jgi:hypothetical protein
MIRYIVFDTDFFFCFFDTDYYCDICKVYSYGIILENRIYSNFDQRSTVPFIENFNPTGLRKPSSSTKDFTKSSGTKKLF